MSAIIGREKEIKELVELYDSDKSEFVAVYGRRRIGKTFLVDEALKGKITFRHAGLSPVDEVGKKVSRILTGIQGDGSLPLPTMRWCRKELWPGRQRVTSTGATVLRLIHKLS